VQAVVLVAVRIFASPQGAIAVAAVCLAALVAYWLAYLVIWLDPGERLLMRDVGRTFTSRLRTA
jgi:hypothetical protein